MGLSEQAQRPMATGQVSGRRRPGVAAGVLRHSLDRSASTPGSLDHRENQVIEAASRALASFVD